MGTQGFGEWYDGGELIHLLYLLSIEQPRTWTSLRALKLDYEFPVTFFSAHNEATISLFIIHYLITFH